MGTLLTGNIFQPACPPGMESRQADSNWTLGVNRVTTHLTVLLLARKPSPAAEQNEDLGHDGHLFRTVNGQQIQPINRKDSRKDWPQAWQCDSGLG